MCVHLMDLINTFHGIGIIVTIVPNVNSSIIIPKKIVSTDSLIQIGKIETKLIERRIKLSPIKYQNLKHLFCEKHNTVSLFWSCTWLLKPKWPLWNCFMQMVYTGSHPGESSVVFMPMTDLKANDEACIFSTMHFIVGQAKKYNADPILTFDQPLYQKTYEMQGKESENSDLKGIVLRLGGLHICMKFLGSIGHFMSSSRLREVLETIYGSDTVPHMLSDSAISRISWVYLIVSGVLYAKIISDVCECPLQDQFSAEESEKDLFSNKLPASKLDKVSQVFDQLKEQNITSEEVANDIDVKEMLARISQYE